MPLQKIKITPTNLFLLDALGALISAFLLSFVLVKLKSIIGMPVEVLYILAAVPAVFALYSFSCFFFVRERWRPFLKLIAIANSVYCLVSLAMIFYHYEELTKLGIAYFLVEIVIVLLLVGVEWRVASR